MHAQSQLPWLAAATALGTVFMAACTTVSRGPTDASGAFASASPPEAASSSSHEPGAVTVPIESSTPADSAIANDGANEDAPGASGSVACGDVRGCLEACTYCEQVRRRHAQEVITRCADGCPPLDKGDKPASVPHALHGLLLNGRTATARTRCSDLGGAWHGVPSAEAHTYQGRCVGAPGPWGLAAEWWLGQTGDNLDRIEMRIGVAEHESTEQVARWVAQLVASELGAPSYVDDDAYVWMPTTGPYWKVLALDKHREVRLWLKEQL